MLLLYKSPDMLDTVYYCPFLFVTLSDMLFTIMSPVYLVTLLDLCYTVIYIAYILFYVYVADFITVYAQYSGMVMLYTAYLHVHFHHVITIQQYLLYKTG